MKNAVIDPVTLTFDLSTPKPCHFQDIQRSFPVPCLNTLGSFVLELCYGQTDKQVASNDQLCLSASLTIGGHMSTFKRMRTHALMSLDNRKTTLKSYNDAVVDNDVRHITVNVDSIDIAVIKRLIHEHVSV